VEDVNFLRGAVENFCIFGKVEKKKL
jgi:hypothetical protein